MTSDSRLFRDTRRRSELADPVPLYEAKMVHQFDHRWATYVGDGDDSRDMTEAEKQDSSREVQPRYWVERSEVDARLSEKSWSPHWLLGFRNVCRATDERTAISGVFPRVGVGHSMPLILPATTTGLAASLTGLLSSLAFDYVVRQKLGGTNFTLGYVKQIAAPGPAQLSLCVIDHIVPRVLELTYTAHDLQPFYADVVAENPAWDQRTGAERGQPWCWNPERRALLRAELDAIYARLYGLTRDELRYILDPADVMGADYPSETFRVPKDKEMRLYGEYRTRRLVLGAWDRMQAGAP